MTPISDASSLTGPLTGVRIVDFCSFIAGSYGAMLLGELGAEVIKIESLEGDAARHWGPFLAGESAFFQGWNSNKRSLAIDVRRPEGRAVILELIARADVVIENFRPGVTGKLGIDYPAARAVNPKIIYCSSTAFGPRGPLSKRPGYDPILQSMSGAAAGNVRFSGKVAICSVAVSDYQAAMLGTTGICAALYHRERTGEGQHVETSLLEAALSVQSHMFVEPLDCAPEGPLGIYPYRLFETSDDQIFIACPTDKFWNILCDALGASDLGADARFATNAGRVACGEELTEKLQPYFKTKTTQAWETYLVERGVPCGPVRPYADFFRHEQVEAMEMNPVIEHPGIGRLRVVGVPIRFEKTPGRIRRPSPRLGEHTTEILQELGYPLEKVASLAASGVIAHAHGASR